MFSWLSIYSTLNIILHIVIVIGEKYVIRYAFVIQFVDVDML